MGLDPSPGFARRAPIYMGSISGQGGWEVCARCGEACPSLLQRVVPSYLERGVVCVCPECDKVLDLDERLARRLYPEWAVIIDTPPEERFKELFIAARVLFREKVKAEEKIVPTLAFAAEVSAGISARVRDKESVVSAPGAPSFRSEAVSWFTYRSGGARPIKVVDGVVLLERSLRVVVSNYARACWHGEFAADDLNRSWRALIDASLYRSPPAPEQVSRVYENTLSRGGFSREWLYDVPNIGFEFREGFLRITVEAQDQPIGYKLHMSTENRRKMPTENLRKETRFPHPNSVATLYKAIKGNDPTGGGYLLKNMIPACVAYYLRHFGRVKPNGEIHRLINTHVLCEKTLPEDGFTTSESSQLWRDVRKLTGKLVAESRAFYS